MSTKKTIKSQQHAAAALDLEKSGDHAGAIKLYQKAVTADPSNVQAWNRQMILYRKNKSKEDEAKLINTAISEYKKQADARKEKWLQENQSKADSSRELAKVLGLLEEDGMPAGGDNTLEKWESRLYLLEYRIKTARKKKGRRS